MKLLIHTVALASVMAAPALAQEATPDPATMTCADFTALDSGAQAEVVQALKTSLGGMEGTETSEASTEETGEPEELTAGAEQTASSGDAEQGASSADDAAQEAASGDDSTIVTGVESAEPPIGDAEAEAASEVPTEMEGGDAGMEPEGDARLNQQATASGEEAEDAMALSRLIGACADEPTMSVTSAMTSAQDDQADSD